MSRKPAGYWTEARVREEAAKYGSKAEFVRGCNSAYNAARRLGIIDDLFENQYHCYWTEARVREEAAKHSTKTEFVRWCNSAYNAARRLGLIDDLFENQRIQRCSWDEEVVRAEAAKYGTKAEFKRGCQSAYGAARRLGIIDNLGFSTHRSWDEAAVRAEAAKYSTKKEFVRGCESAYRVAHRLGIIDDLGFEDRAPSDNDTIYIWRAVGQWHQGLPVFKIGVTSERLGDVRIRDCARAGGFTAALVAAVPTWMDATRVEDHLHSFGIDPVGVVSMVQPSSGHWMRSNLSRSCT